MRFDDSRHELGIEGASGFGTDMLVERGPVPVELEDDEAIGILRPAVHVEHPVARFRSHRRRVLRDQGLHLVRCPGERRELGVEGDVLVAHACAAPVMIATASVMVCDCGVMVAARLPRRWM